MSSPSTDALKAEIDAGRMRTGNEVQGSSGLPVTTTIKTMYVDASSDLALSVPLLASQPTITDALMNLTGTPNGNIMTQTIVAAASATTATAAGWIRVDMVSGNDALFSTSAYYIPLVTLT